MSCEGEKEVHSTVTGRAVTLRGGEQKRETWHREREGSRRHVASSGGYVVVRRNWSIQEHERVAANQSIRQDGTSRGRVE